MLTTLVAGRMALLITLFLVLVNIFNNVNTNSPKAEGLTAIEIWMLACILFVFGALVVYAVVLYLKQKKSLDASLPCRCEVRIQYNYTMQYMFSKSLLHHQLFKTLTKAIMKTIQY